MPFLQAGFNADNTKTGIYAKTTSTSVRTPAAWAELRRFACGDYFWLGLGRHRFLAWGECCCIVDHIPLPVALTCADWPQCELPV